MMLFTYRFETHESMHIDIFYLNSTDEVLSGFPEKSPILQHIIQFVVTLTHLHSLVLLF